MKNVLKVAALLTAVIALAFVTSCNLEEEAKDALGLSEDLPQSFRGTWTDTNDNEVVLTNSSISYHDGQQENFDVVSVITANGVDVYTIGVDDDDDEADYYVKQPGSTDELEITTEAVSCSPDCYTTYTKVE